MPSQLPPPCTTPQLTCFAPQGPGPPHTPQTWNPPISNYPVPTCASGPGATIPHLPELVPLYSPKFSTHRTCVPPGWVPLHTPSWLAPSCQPTDISPSLLKPVCKVCTEVTPSSSKQTPMQGYKEHKTIKKRDNTKGRQENSTNRLPKMEIYELPYK